MFRTINHNSNVEAFVVPSADIATTTTGNGDSSDVHFFQRREAVVSANAATPLSLLPLAVVVPGAATVPWKQDTAGDTAASASPLPRVNCVAFSHANSGDQRDSLLAASLANGQLFVYRIRASERAPKEIARLTLPQSHSAPKNCVPVNSECRRCCFSPDNELLAAAFGTNLVVFRRQQEKGKPDEVSFTLLCVCQQAHRKHTANILSIAWSRCGTLLASGAEDGTIAVHTRVDETTTSRRAPSGAVKSSSISFEVRCFQPEKDTFIWEHSSAVTALDFSVDGSLAAGSAEGALLIIDIAAADGVPRVIHNINVAEAMAGVGPGAAGAAAAFEKSAIGSVSFSTAGRRLTVCRQNFVIRFSLSDKRVLLDNTLKHAHGIVHSASHPTDPSLTLSAGALGRVYAWTTDVRQHESLLSFTQTSHSGRVECVTIQPRADDTGSSSLQQQQQHQIVELSAPSSSVVATASEDGTLKLWLLVRGFKVLSTTVPAAVNDVLLLPKDDDATAVCIWGKEGDNDAGAGAPEEMVMPLKEVALKNELKKPSSLSSPLNSPSRECSRCAALQRRVAELEAEVERLKQ